jgi:hypothetical protein
MSSPQIPQLLLETVISNETSAAMSWEEVSVARKDRDAVSKFLGSHGIELLREMTAQGVHFAALIPLDRQTAAVIEGLIDLTEKPIFTKILTANDLSSLTLDDLKKVRNALDKWKVKFGVSI